MVPTVRISLANNNNIFVTMLPFNVQAYFCLTCCFSVSQKDPGIKVHESAILMELLIHIYNRNSHLHVCILPVFSPPCGPIEAYCSSFVLFVGQTGAKRNIFQRSLIRFLSTDFSALPRNMTCTHLNFFGIPCSLFYWSVVDVLVRLESILPPVYDPMIHQIVDRNTLIDY